METGSVIGGQFDSMLAKLIVTGATRDEALDRSRRALAEFNVEGLATVIPFHRAVVSDPAFIGDKDGFSVHTRWIETEWDNTVEPFTGGGARRRGRGHAAADGRRRGRWPAPGGVAARRHGYRQRRPAAPGPRCDPQEAQGPQARCARRSRAASGDAVTAPMQGTVVKVAVEEGQQVSAGDLIVVLEAMKMENPVTAHKDGTVTGLAVEAGSAITQGTVIAELKD